MPDFDNVKHDGPPIDLNGGAKESSFISIVGIELIESRLSILEMAQSEFDKRDRLIKIDTDTNRNRVTNLLQRTEPRIALIEEVLITAGLLMYNNKGEIVKTPPKEDAAIKVRNKAKPKRNKRNVTRVTRKKTKPKTKRQ